MTTNTWAKKESEAFIADPVHSGIQLGPHLCSAWSRPLSRPSWLLKCAASGRLAQAAFVVRNNERIVGLEFGGGSAVALRSGHRGFRGKLDPVPGKKDGERYRTDGDSGNLLPLNLIFGIVHP